jgi:hypothetical protein
MPNPIKLRRPIFTSFTFAQSPTIYVKTQGGELQPKPTLTTHTDNNSFWSQLNIGNTWLCVKCKLTTTYGILGSWGYAGVCQECMAGRCVQSVLGGASNDALLVCGIGLFGGWREPVAFWSQSKGKSCLRRRYFLRVSALLAEEVFPLALTVFLQREQAKWLSSILTIRLKHWGQVIKVVSRMLHP